MKQIKWHFPETEIYFISSPENFENDVRKNRNVLRLSSNSLPKIINENGNNLTTTSPDHTSISSNPTSESIKAVSVGSKKSKTSRSSSDGLLRVSGDVVPTTTPTPSLEDSTSDSSSSLPGDSVAE